MLVTIGKILNENRYNNSYRIFNIYVRGLLQKLDLLLNFVFGAGLLPCSMKQVISN